MGDSVDKIASMLKQESRFFLGIGRPEIQTLTDSLELLGEFLKEASEKTKKRVMGESVKSWLEETKDASESVKFVADDCFLRLSRVLEDRRIANFIGRLGRGFSLLDTSRRLTYDLQNQKALPFIDKGKRPTKRQEDSEKARPNELRNDARKPFYSYIEDCVDSAAEDVMTLTLEGPPECSVIALVGPGEIGKTTIARKIYDSEKVRDHFDCRVWIDIPTSFQIKELLVFMIKKIAGAGQDDVSGLDDGMRMAELVGTLTQSLQEKRYLFVFDECNQEVWNVIKHGFPNNGKGSRIIITTPINTIKEGSFDYIWRLGPLSDEESRELFRGIAFRDEPDARCPRELEKLTSEIVGKCKGFPLPIAALAGFLYKKDKVESEWQKIHRNFGTEVNTLLHPPTVIEVIGLSFHDLPPHLQSCFLFFSVFPEEYLIPNDKLFKLWIAEDFVEDIRGKTLEEVAEDYLNELIDRDMVQACEGFYGLERFCQVHSVMHKIARLKAEQLHFCSVFDEKNSNNSRGSRRVSIHNNVGDASETMTGSQVHSAFIFNNTGFLSRPFLVSLIRKWRHLTLLSLESSLIDHLPEALGNLVDLKYLSVKSTKVRKLPGSVYSLKNLLTLDLRNTLLSELPMEIEKLKNLQHLMASYYEEKALGDSTRGVRMNLTIASLENLETLLIIEAFSSTYFLVKLSKLRRLRRLGISGLASEQGKSLSTCIQEITSLESLTLRAADGKQTLDLQAISSPPPNLKHLVLKGLLPELPNWIIGLQNLTILCLSLSKLTKSPLTHLRHLPKLTSLWLYRAYEGEKLVFEKDDFPRLKLLVLQGFLHLTTMEIKGGALPCLEEFRIGSNPLLTKVPPGIRHLRKLKVLANYDMPEKFVRSMLAYKGWNYRKVEHIPSVLFWYRVDGRSYKLYELGDSKLVDHLQGLPTKTELITPQSQQEYELSFCGSDEDEDEDEEDNEDDVGELTFPSSRRFFSQRNSFSSGFYTDDIEE